MRACVCTGYFSSWVAFFASLMFFQRTGLAAIAGTRSEEAPQQGLGSQV